MKILSSENICIKVNTFFIYLLCLKAEYMHVKSVSRG